MTTENEDHTPSPFRSFVVLAGACLGLAGLMWLRQNLTPPPAGGAAPGASSEPPHPGASGGAPSSAPAEASAPPANENQPTATPSKTEASAAATETAASKPAKSETAKAAQDSAPDDLTAIDGIGPKIAQVLAASGVRTYAELADKTAGEIREILVAANPRYRMFDPVSWPEQARAAAAGPN